MDNGCIHRYYEALLNRSLVSIRNILVKNFDSALYKLIKTPVNLLGYIV